jgi:hypothetical protein
MNPKRKARELVNQFLEKIPFADTKVYKDWKKEMNDKAKQCALIAVDEILENVNYFFNELEKDGLPNKFDDEIEYWNEIKQEIIKL